MLRKLFNTGTYTTSINIALLILRIVAAGFLLTHGWTKLEKIMNGPPYAFSDPVGLGVTLSLYLVAFAEVICSILVGLGFAVRLTTIPVIIAMLVASFAANAGEPFASKELSLLYATIYLFIFITGAGKISIDRLLVKKKHR